MAELTVEAMICAAEASLRQDESPWLAVGRIVLSPGRFSQLQMGANATAPLNPWVPAVTLEVSPLCGDRAAILVNRDGLIAGIFSSETGGVHWFDQRLMKRFSGPTFRFEDERPPFAGALEGEVG